MAKIFNKFFRKKITDLRNKTATEARIAPTTRQEQLAKPKDRTTPPIQDKENRASHPKKSSEKDER